MPFPVQGATTVTSDVSFAVKKRLYRDQKKLYYNN